MIEEETYALDGGLDEKARMHSHGRRPDEMNWVNLWLCPLCTRPRSTRSCDEPVRGHN